MNKKYRYTGFGCKGERAFAHENALKQLDQQGAAWFVLKPHDSVKVFLNQEQYQNTLFIDLDQQNVFEQRCREIYDAYDYSLSLTCASFILSLAETALMMFYGVSVLEEYALFVAIIIFIANFVFAYELHSQQMQYAHTEIDASSIYFMS